MKNTQQCPATITVFYDQFRRKIADIETVEQRNGILADMEESFRECAGAEPQSRDRLSMIHQLLKRKCLEEMPW